MTEIVILAKNLTKTYETRGELVHALGGISLEILKGESVAVMGQSGSGKTTMLSIIGGLSRPSQGSVEIEGTDLYALPQEMRADFRLKKIGFVFQQFQLIPYLTALENVMLPLASARGSAREKRERASRVLKRVGILGEINRLPGELSGGEQERVAIARALVNEPPLILADEPTGSLDTRTGTEIMELFEDLNRQGQTILMVTHNPLNTAYMNRTIYMKDGLISPAPAEKDFSVLSSGAVS